MISDREKALLDKPNIAHLATLDPDGTPQVTPVWVDTQDGLIRVNSARGRAKVRNVEANPAVALSMADQDNPYEMVSIRGRVIQITEEGADDHIDSLSKKYLGQESYPFRTPEERRVMIVIEPHKVVSQLG